MPLPSFERLSLRTSGLGASKEVADQRPDGPWDRIAEILKEQAIEAVVVEIYGPNYVERAFYNGDCGDSLLRQRGVVEREDALAKLRSRPFGIRFRLYPLSRPDPNVASLQRILNDDIARLKDELDTLVNAAHKSLHTFRYYMREDVFKWDDMPFDLIAEQPTLIKGMKTGSDGIDFSLDPAALKGPGDQLGYEWYFMRQLAHQVREYLSTRGNLSKRVVEVRPDVKWNETRAYPEQFHASVYWPIVFPGQDETSMNRALGDEDHLYIQEDLSKFFRTKGPSEVYGDGVYSVPRTRLSFSMRIDPLNLLKGVSRDFRDEVESGRRQE